MPPANRDWFHFHGFAKPNDDADRLSAGHRIARTCLDRGVVRGRCYQSISARLSASERVSAGLTRSIPVLRRMSQKGRLCRKTPGLPWYNRLTFASHDGRGAVDDGERQVQQDALFYEFSLERHVPEKHLLRAIDRFVELDGVRAHLAPFYSETGRPSIDPELLIRMLIVGYCFGIRSERRLCEEVHLNLAYRWFCRLGLDGAVPDHSTFSKNRHGRFRDSDLLRQVFETTVRRCMAEGLVGGEGFAVDASMVEADANRQRGVPGSDGLAPEAANRAVREYLAVLDDAAFGAATPVVPKFISPADPASRWTAANGGLAFFAYCTNYTPLTPESENPWVR